MRTPVNTAAPPDDELARLRVPPHSVEAEQSVLGSLLLDNLAWDHAADLLADSDFYRYEHRLIYAAIAALVSQSKPADVVTVFEHLQSLGKAEDAGGLAYLNAMAQSVPSGGNTRRYAEIVRERSILRKLIEVGDQITTAAFNHGSRSANDVLGLAESALHSIGETTARQRQGFVIVGQLMFTVCDDVQRLADAGADGAPGIRTGFHDLDRETTGLQRGDLIILGARSSMGKTAFALNIAENVAVKEGLPVLVFSMEMTGVQLAKRLAGSVGRVDQQHIRSGQLDREEWERFADATEALQSVPLYVDETPALSSSELRSRARRMVRQVGQLGLIVIDYVQLMSSGRGSSQENRATELGEITGALKALAKELKCPVLALSQINRGVESRTDKRPLMSDLRESGAIEQDADVILLLYRDDYYNKDSKEPGVAELIIAKQRNGPTGTVRLAFQGALTRFESLAR